MKRKREPRGLSALKRWNLLGYSFVYLSIPTFHPFITISLRRGTSANQNQFMIARSKSNAPAMPMSTGRPMPRGKMRPLGTGRYPSISQKMTVALAMSITPKKPTTINQPGKSSFHICTSCLKSKNFRLKAIMNTVKAKSYLLAPLLLCRGWESNPHDLTIRKF